MRAAGNEQKWHLVFDMVYNAQTFETWGQDYRSYLILAPRFKGLGVVQHICIPSQTQVNQVCSSKTQRQIGNLCFGLIMPCVTWFALRMFRKLKQPEWLPSGADLFFFRADINPRWEDADNRHGGKFTIFPDRRQVNVL